MGIAGDLQANIFSIIAGIMHLGNISFTEKGNYAIPEDEGCKLTEKMIFLMSLFFYHQFYSSQPIFLV